MNWNREQHARIKDIFLDVIDLGAEEREKKLTELSTSEPDIVAEVRLLVAKHFSRTIMVSTQVASTTLAQSSALSTLTLQQVNSRFVGGLLPISFAISATLILGTLGWWLQSEVTYSTQRLIRESLEKTATQKSDVVDQWVSMHKNRFSSWGRIKEIQVCTKALEGLVDKTAPPNARFETLSQAPEQKQLALAFQQLTYGPTSKNRELLMGASSIGRCILNLGKVGSSHWRMEQHARIAITRYRANTRGCSVPPKGRTIKNGLRISSRTHSGVYHPTNGIHGYAATC